MHIKIYWYNNCLSLGMVNANGELKKKWNKTKQFQQNNNKWNNQSYNKLPILNVAVSFETWSNWKHGFKVMLNTKNILDPRQCRIEKISLIQRNGEHKDKKLK